MASPTNYTLKVLDEITVLIRSLHPQIKAVIRSAFQAILEEPQVGKALKDELQGLRSYRVKRCRIIYRISSKTKHLEIITIGPRKNIYEETFKIISKEEKKK